MSIKYITFFVLIFFFIKVIKSEESNNQISSIEEDVSIKTSDDEIIKEKEIEPLEHNIKIKRGASLFEFSFFYQPETLISKNILFLNGKVKSNLFFIQNIFDIVGEYNYGKDIFGEDIVTACYNPRIRVLWGNDTYVTATTFNSINDLHLKTGDHAHGVIFNYFWFRQLWLELNLCHLLNIPFSNKHTLTIGAFPFELGHAVSLGKFYLYLPILADGYYVDINIDQYAFGGKISGHINKLFSYDIYGAILQCHSDLSNFNFLGSPILVQRSSMRSRTPQHMRRGSGLNIDEYLIASRLKINCIKDNPDQNYKTINLKKLYLEPYILYVRNYKNGFRLNKGTSDLFTLGFYGQFQSGNIEIDIEFAKNLGKEHVPMQDFNSKEFSNSDGIETIINSCVFDTNTDSNALATPENQAIIRNSYKSPIDNGRLISKNLINSNCRFTSPYEIKYGGTLFIADLSYTIIRDCFKINGWCCFASGDNDRYCKEPINSIVEYDGFIPVNESYNGRRVSSILYLGFGQFPHIVNGTTPLESKFTDLVLYGMSLEFLNKKNKIPWNVLVNLISFYKDNDFFVCKNNGLKTYFLDKFLGIELNIIAEFKPIKDLNVYCFPAIFIPGKFFKQIKHVHTDRLFSLLSDDISCFLNAGFQYSF